jgi:hypothetical protein
MTDLITQFYENVTAQIMLVPEGTATLASVIAALMIGYLGFLQSQHQARRRYTLTIIMERLSNSDLSRATLLVADYARRGDVFVEATDNQEEHQLVNLLLNYYEFVAIAYIKKSLDRGTVRRQQKNAMKSAFRVCEPYIKNRRKELRRKTLYREFELLTTRYF